MKAYFLSVKTIVAGCAFAFACVVAIGLWVMENVLKGKN